MGMTPEQIKTNRIAAMHGYQHVVEDTIPASSFQPGDAAIVLTHKGEPIMSGAVEEIKEPDFEGYSSLRVGDQWFCERSYKFRVL